MLRLLLWFCAPAIALVFFGYLFAFPLQVIGGITVFVVVVLWFSFVAAKDMEQRAWALTRQRQAEAQAEAEAQAKTMVPAPPLRAYPADDAKPLASLRISYSVDPRPPGAPPRRRRRR